MAAAAIALTLVSSVMQASATAAAGKAEQEAGLARQAALDHQAAQARSIAGQERASSQRGAIEQRRQARLLSSKALARAAAGGGGTDDPTVSNILGDIGAEGEFRALTELFQGEEAARGLEMQADLRVFEGQQAKRAGDTARKLANRQAFTQLLSGAAGAAKMGYSAGYGSSAPSTTLSSGHSLGGYYG